MDQALAPAAVLLTPTLALDAGTRTLIWSGVLIGVVIAAVAGLLLLRRKITTPGGSMGAMPSIGLEDLRRMKDRGQISEEEFQHARNRVIRKASQRMAAQQASSGESADGAAGTGPGAGVTPGSAGISGHASDASRARALPAPTQIPSRRAPAPRVHRPSTPGAPPARPNGGYPTDSAG